MKEEPRDLRDVARRLGFPPTHALQLPRSQALPQVPDPYQNSQARRQAPHPRQSGDISGSISANGPHSVSGGRALAGPWNQMPNSEQNRRPASASHDSPLGPIHLVNGGIVLGDQPTAQGSPVIDGTGDGPLFFMHPGDPMREELPPCDPPEAVWALVGSLFVQLRSRYLLEREEAARKLGEIAIRCPLLPIAPMLRGARDSAAQESEPRITQLLDETISFIETRIWDCRHALEVMKFEIIQDVPNVARYNSAINYLHRPNHKCEAVIAEVERLGYGFLGLVEGMSEAELRAIAKMIGVDRAAARRKE